MIKNLLFGLPTMGICLLLQALLFAVAIRYYTRRHKHLDTPSFWSNLVVIHGVMMLLVLGNIAQLTIWAMLFRALGEFDDLGTAIYHSAVNFATLGYGDIVMSERYRLLGPLEAINGVLMIGVSTAALTTAFQNAIRRTLQSRQEQTSQAPPRDG